MVDGEGGSSERCLKWDGGGHQGIFQNILKLGWVKAKVVHRAGGFESVPPLENFNHTPSVCDLYLAEHCDLIFSIESLPVFQENIFFKKNCCLHKY